MPESLLLVQCFQGKRLLIAGHPWHTLVCHLWEKNVPQVRTGHCRDHSSHAQPGVTALGIFGGGGCQLILRLLRVRMGEVMMSPVLHGFPSPSLRGRPPSLQEGTMLRSWGASLQAEAPDPQRTKHKE